jgi:pimeloyl-ACP methyl ester carboxylesterase
MMSLMRQGWDSPDPSYRQLFASQFMPNATKEQWEAENEAMRASASPETAARYYQVFGEVDVTALLPRVRAPTLVMHVRGDLRVPFESGRQLAAAIPNARFVALPGNSHAFSLGSPAADRYLEEVRLFVVG